MDIFKERHRVDEDVITISKVDISFTRVLQLTGLAVSGLVGITTFLMAMLSSTIKPSKHYNLAPSVRGVAIERAVVSPQEAGLPYIFYDFSFEELPVHFSGEFQGEYLRDQYLDQGIYFTLDLQKRIAAEEEIGYTKSLDGTLDRSHISFTLKHPSKQVGFFVQSGSSLNFSEWHSRIPLDITAYNRQGLEILTETVFTCKDGHVSCAPQFIGVDGGKQTINRVDISSQAYQEFSLGDIYF